MVSEFKSNKKEAKRNECEIEIRIMQIHIRISDMLDSKASLA